MGPNFDVAKDNLLIIDGKIEAFGDEAKKKAIKQNIEISESGNKLIVLCTGFPPINDVNFAVGVAKLRYLKVDRAAISFN